MKRLIYALFLLSQTAYAGQITIFNVPGSSGTVITSQYLNPIYPSIALDTSTTSNLAAPGNPCNWTIQIGNGDASKNKVLVLACGETNNFITSAQLGSQAFTRQQRTLWPGQFIGSDLWYLVNPSSGTQGISLILDGGQCGGNTTTAKVFCTAIDFTGVSQATPIDISTGAFANTTSINATASLASSTDMLFDSIVQNGFTKSMNPANNQIILSSTTNLIQGYATEQSYLGPETSGGSTQLGWTIGGIGGNVVYTWAALKQAP